MYGWIETGGSLLLTSPTDMVMRTSSPQTTIAIGSGECNLAALYINDNTIGLKTLPNTLLSAVPNINSLALSNYGSNYNFFLPSLYDLSVNGNVITNGSFVFASTAPSDINATASNNDATVRISPCNLEYYNNATITGYADAVGVARNRIYVADHLKLTNSKVYVKSARVFQTQSTTVIAANNLPAPGYIIKLNASVSENIIANTMVLINRRTYQLWRKSIMPDNITNSGGLLVAVELTSFYDDQGPLNFKAGDYIDIEILEDVQVNNNLKILYSESKVLSYSLSNLEEFDSSILKVTLEMDNPGTDFFSVGNYYMFTASVTDDDMKRDPTHILVLTEYKDVSQGLSTTAKKRYALTLMIPNKRDAIPLDIMQMILDSYFDTYKLVYLFVFDALAIPKPIQEQVVVGVTVPATDRRKRMYITGSPTLLSITNSLDTSPDFTKGLDYISYDNLTFNVRSHGITTYDDASVVLDVGHHLDSQSFVIMRRNVKYAMLGIPLTVTETIGVNADSVQYVFTTLFPDIITFASSYIGKYIYIIDTTMSSIWYVIDIAINELNQNILVVKCINPTYKAQYPNVLDMPDVNTQRNIFVIPFKVITLTLLGTTENISYIPQSLGIGTMNVRERLTINGSASVQDAFVFYNNTSTNPFKVTYSSNVISLNGRFLINPNNATVSSDLNVQGNLLAASVFYTSDERRKYNIRDAHALKDLAKMRDIKVKTFELAHDDTQCIHKGVLAHEIMKTYPEAVMQNKDVLKFIRPLNASIDNSANVLRVDTTSLNKDKGTDTDKQDDNYDTSRCAYDRKLLNHLQAGATIVLQQGSMIYYCKLESVLGAHEYKISRSCPEDMFLPDKCTLIGVEDLVYSVNYQYLFMSALNAMKTLAEDVEDLKTRLQSQST